MLRRITILVMFLVLSNILMLGCGGSRGSPSAPQIPHVIERNNFQGTPIIQDVEIPNCDSDEDLQTTQVVEQKFEHKVEILPNSPSVSTSKLAQAVRDHYEVESLVEVAKYSVVANVPSGSIFTYQIEWTEDWREGNIEMGAEDDNPEATYKFLESLVGGVVGVETASCS